MALSEVHAADYEAIVFIDGYHYDESNAEAIRIAQEAVAQNKIVAAICIAPTVPSPTLMPAATLQPTATSVPATNTPISVTDTPVPPTVTALLTSAAPAANNAYLGQVPSGLTPQVFAPGIVSVDGATDFAATFFAPWNGVLLYAPDGWSSKRHL